MILYNLSNKVKFQALIAVKLNQTIKINQFKKLTIILKKYKKINIIKIFK